MALNSNRKSASSGSRTEVSGRRSTQNRSRNRQSVRIGDIDRLERRARATRPPSRGFRNAIIAVVAILVVGAAFLSLRFTPLFTIESVEVNGADHLTSNDLGALITVPKGSTLLNVDGDHIEESLLRDTWVESVTIDRVFPSTLAVNIIERKIKAVVEVITADGASIQPWAIAADGMWLMAIPDQDSELGQAISAQIYADAAAALHIVDVPYGVEPVLGTICTDGSVNNALKIIDGLSTELEDQITTVAAVDPQSAQLTLDNGIEIAFGDAEDIREKERICLKLMEDYPGRIAYINVRTPDRPTWRAL